MVLGGSYHIPLMHGLLDEQAMREVLSSPTMDSGSVDREYRSIWSGSPTGAAFNNDMIQEMRKIKYAETRAREKAIEKGDFYVVSADMAKDGTANTAVIVWKVSPKEFNFNYYLVNAFQIDSSDYEVVARRIKHALSDYKAVLFVYDANGIGASLRDWLNKEQIDPTTNSLLPAYGIINPPKQSEKDIKKVPKDRTICYEVKASGEINGHINKIFFAKMGTKSLRFLVKSNEAVDNFSKNKNFLQMSNAKKKTTLNPYHFVDKLEEEMKNLDIVDVSDTVNPNNLKVKQRSSKIQKDFYSAAAYGLYGIHQEIEVAYYSKKRKAKSKLSDFIMIV